MKNSRSFPGFRTAVLLAALAGSAGVFTLNGWAVDLNNSAITLNGGTDSDDYNVGNSFSSITLAAGSSDETMTGTVELSAANSAVDIINSSSANLTLQGNLVFDAVQNTDRVAVVAANGTGSITLTGQYISPDLTTDQRSTNGGIGASSLQFGGGNGAANYYLAPTADFSQMEAPAMDHSTNDDGKTGLILAAGNLDIENSTFVPGQFISVEFNPGVNHTLNVIGAQDINLSVFSNIAGTAAGQYTVSQSTADSSIWAGSFSQNGGMTASVVDGGRLTFTSLVGGFQPVGFIKTGAGTVVLADSGGNNYTIGGSVTADIQQGTVLVTNTSGSAFGATTLTNDGHGVDNGTVDVEAGATLGGTGTIQQTIVAMDPNGGSILTAGDPGQANLGIKPTIGLLTVNNVSAPNGLTLDFKLTANVTGSVGPAFGVDNDTILINNFTVGGDSGPTAMVTVNISMMGDTLATGVPYVLLFSSNGTWTEGSNVKFCFNLPWGYELDPNYLEGVDQGGNQTPGYSFSTLNGDQNLVVQFIFVPEPSTCALMALAGLTFLMARRRLKA